MVLKEREVYTNMKYVKESTYKQYITGELNRFDERNNGFARAAQNGGYDLMHDKSIINAMKKISGKTILEHAMWASSRTVDYILRKTTSAREEEAIYNHKYRLKDPQPKAMSLIIKKMAHWFGADLVGITKLNPLWIYTHWSLDSAQYCGNEDLEGQEISLPKEYNRVIVIATEMSNQEIQKSPAVEAATDLGYSKVAFIVSSLATFIRELGYKAMPAVNEIGLSIPMAIDAGLGELGRNGLLITPEYGSSVRIAKVFTNLPLDCDLPIDFGIQKFCEKCGLCAKYCSADALCKGKRMDKGWDKSNSIGLLKWPINAMKCMNFWVDNGNHCSVCIRVCPFTKSNKFYNKTLKIFSSRRKLTKPLVSLHEILGLGKQKENYYFSKIQNPEVVEKDD